jgi:hypothetical protein
MSRSVSGQPCGYWCPDSPAYRIHILYLQAQRKFSCLFNGNAAPFLANFGRDCVCFVLFCLVGLSCLLCFRSRQRAIEARWCLGPAPRGSPSFGCGARRPSMEGGNDRSRVAPGPRSTAGRLRVWVIPAESTQRADNERPASGLSEHAPASRVASDSPPRASRYAPLCSRRERRLRNPAAHPVPDHSLRRSLHGSGRSAPSRDKPLTARLVGRRDRERRGANARARSNFISLHLSIRMPPCMFCPHRGSDHDWTSPACSARPYCSCVLKHPRRLRGRCLIPDCRCLKYVPRTDRPKPVNRYIGRLRR